MTKSSPPRRGFTLIEMMVVLLIIVVVSALIIPEMTGSLQGELLQKTGRDIVDACNVAYSGAVTVNDIRRVRFDQSESKIVVEKAVNHEGSLKFVIADEVSNAVTGLDERISVKFLRGQSKDLPSEDLPENRIKDDPEEVSALVFYPDGTANPAEIVLRDQVGFTLRMRMNPITARLKILQPKDVSNL